MKLAKLKEYYNLGGIIKGLSAVPVDGGWLLTIEATCSPYGATLETATGQEKVYTTLESLNNDVARVIGSRQTWSMSL